MLKRCIIECCTSVILGWRLACRLLRIRLGVRSCGDQDLMPEGGSVAVWRGSGYAGEGLEIGGSLVNGGGAVGEHKGRSWAGQV